MQKNEMDLNRMTNRSTKGITYRGQRMVIIFLREAQDILFCYTGFQVSLVSINAEGKGIQVPTADPLLQRDVYLLGCRLIQYGPAKVGTTALSL